MIACSSRQTYKNKIIHDSKKDSQSNTKHKKTEDNILPSNHNRYVSSESEEHSNLSTTINDVTTDFAALAKAPISIGGHFKFKDDQNSAENDCHKTVSEWFSPLDIKMLSQSVGAIPFHIRCEIDEEYVKGDHLENYCRVAKENKDKFEGYLASLNVLQNDSFCYFSAQKSAGCDNERLEVNANLLTTEDSTKDFHSGRFSWVYLF